MKTATSTARIHLSLHVTDIERSVEFYERLFDAAPAVVREDYAKFDLQEPAVNFSMLQGAPGSGGALSHLGIQLESVEDLERTRARVLEYGWTPRDERQVDCCYHLQDKFWLTDPDGNSWEFFVTHGRTSEAETACEPESGCCTPGEQ